MTRATRVWALAASAPSTVAAIAATRQIRRNHSTLRRMALPGATPFQAKDSPLTIGCNSPPKASIPPAPTEPPDVLGHHRSLRPICDASAPFPAPAAGRASPQPEQDDFLTGRALL